MRERRCARRARKCCGRWARAKRRNLAAKRKPNNRAAAGKFKSLRVEVKPVAERVAAQNAVFEEQFRKSGAVDEPTIQSETDRYIAWPAQALSYKLGQLKFRELRQWARKELGSKFDIRKFHDEMLDGGTLPLDMLEARTEKWIAEQKVK